ncbi:MAG: dienelactone hydrolase [Rhizobiaceae bacterium]|nr:dienelactone hydrolase [Rhizobiaceae bacterium]
MVFRQVAIGILSFGFGVQIALAENRIDQQLPGAPELAKYGDFSVGVRTLDIVNPNQVEVLNINGAAEKPDPLPRYDRPLTLEIWYPAESGAAGENTLNVFLRDGKTKVQIEGKAVRDAMPEGENHPLVVISHGYPGNRFLLAHLAENLASKGYVVASIDHTDSTYRTQAAFGSTLINRPYDQLFTLAEMDRLSKEKGSFLNGLVDASNAGLIGYSMGGYGAVITMGGGVTQASVDYAWGGPHGTLGVHLSGSETHNNLPDERFKTAIAFAPWGMNTGFWSAETLKGIETPMLFVAGSVDDVSGYENGIRAIWENAVNADRSLLTFENANHNAGAPMPAPIESDKFDDQLGFNVSEHYTDAVWDSVRMNNISQHFVTAWLGKYLKGNGEMDAYLDLVPNSNDSVWAKNEDGSEKPEHTHWHGFPNRTAKGLRFETLKAK